MQVPYKTGPGVRMSKRPLLASHTRCCKAAMYILLIYRLLQRTFMVNCKSDMIQVTRKIRRFSGNSAISRLGSRKLPISELQVARQAESLTTRPPPLPSHEEEASPVWLNVPTKNACDITTIQMESGRSMWSDTARNSHR